MPGVVHCLPFAGPAQKLQCIGHAVTILALEAQRLAELGADHDYDLVEAVLAQLREAKVSSCLLAEMELHAEIFQQLEVSVEDCPWKPVFRDCAANHATGIAVFLEYFDVDTGMRQFGCCRHTAWTGTDNCDLVTCWFGLCIRRR